MKKYIAFILILMLATGSYAQKTVSGTVYDETGKQPLPGASILIEGTTNGTVTNTEGKYSIPEVKDTDVLVFSFIGYNKESVAVGDKTSIEIVLEAAMTNLDELVVIGYGTTKRSDLTGAVASVNTEDLSKSATSNFDQALAGRVAGVSIGSTDGTPGERLNIVIRGGNSITGDNSPLYVIDGMPLEDFDPATINTDDIQSFDVLKDASATAIYGSRGANGVIIINTKKGRTDGKTDVRAIASYRMDWIPSRIQVLSPYEYAKYKEMAAYAQDYYYPGDNVKAFESSYKDPLLYKDAEGTDWQDRVYRQALTKNAKLSINGGNKTTNFYYSGEFLNQEGTMINTGFDKIINNLKLSHKISKKAKLGAQLQYSYLNRKGMNVRGNSYNSVIRDVIRFRPVEPVLDDDLEEGGYDPFNSDYRYYYNPVKNLENTDRQYRSNVFRGSVDFAYNFTKELKLSLKGNYLSDNRKQHVFYGMETQQGARGADRVNGSITTDNYMTLSTSNTLAYKKNFNDEHNTTIMAGMEAQDRKSERAYMRNSHLPTDLLGINNLGLGIAPSIPSTNVGGNRLLSYFGRVNYSYRDKYYFTGTMRADGSSKFKNNPWGYFPSFSTAWRLSRESFILGADWLSNAKLRAGWGVTGNNRIPDFASYNQLGVNSSSGYVWNDGETYSPGVYQNNVGVPDLRWEKTVQTNLGVDFGVLDQRISTTIDFYKKNTTDLLLNAEMSLHSGFDKVQQNIGEVENQGLEIVLNTVNVESNKFRWTTSFNISFNKNKVVSLNDGQTEILTNPGWNGESEYQYVTRIGKPVGMIYGLEFDGIYQVDDFIYDNATGSSVLRDGIPDNGNKIIAPGSVKLVDQNGDGTVNEADRVIIGNPHPKHFGGLSNGFEFFGFDCNVLFQWSYGFDVFNANNLVFGEPTQNFNGLKEIANAWTPYNTDTETNTRVYNAVFGAAPKGNTVNNRAIEDGSYLRLKTISLGYTIPQKVTMKLKISKARISVSANNLFTWTKYSGYDPDVSVGKYGALTPALDYSAYPMSTSIMGGLDITF